MMKENFLQAFGKISQSINLHIGGDFIIYLLANHRKVERIHFLSQDKLKKNEYEKIIGDAFRNFKIENFEFFMNLTDLIYLKAEDLSIYIIYHPYKIYKELNINEINGIKLKWNIKGFSLEDSICLKINMFMNSQDKMETIGNALDLFFGIEKIKLTQDELGKIYEFKYEIPLYEIKNDIKIKIEEVSEYDSNFENLGIELIRKITKKELVNALNKYFV